MKNSIFYYSLLEIKSNIKTHCFNFLSYTLFVFLAISVGLLSNSFLKSYDLHLESEYGRYDYCIINAQDKDSGIENAEKGYCYINSYVYHNNGKYYSVGYYDDTAYNQMSIEMIDGRLPKNKNEIVLEESAYYIFKDNIENDVISLFVKDFKGNESKVTYNIVGIIKNYVHLTPQIATGEAEMPYNIFPSFLISMTPEDTSIKHILLTCNNNENLYELDTYLLNENYLLNTNKFENDTSYLHIALLFLFCTLIILGIVNLYCNIIIHKKKNLELFFRLKCAGATNKDCIKFKLLVAMIILLLSSVFGIAFGYVSSILIIKYLKDNFISYLSFINSGSLVVITLLVTTLTVVGMTLLHDLLASRKRPFELNVDQKNTSNTFKIKDSFFAKHPIGSISMKDVHFNSGKYLSIIMSIFLMLISIISVQVVINGTAYTYDQSMEYDYIIKTYNGATITTFGIPLTNYSFEDRDVDNLVDTGEVESCFAYSRNKMYIHIQGEKDVPPEYVLENHKKNYAYSGELLNVLKKDYIEYGYNETDELYSTTLHGVNKQFMDELLGKDSREIYNENNVVLFTREDSGYYVPGESIVFTAPRIDSNGNYKRIDIELNVACVITIDDKSPLYNLYDGKGYFYCVSQEIIDNKIGYGYHYLLVDLKDKSQYKETESIIDQLDVIHNSDEQYESISNREINEEKWQVITLIKYIGAVMICSICAYSVVTLISVFRNDLINRKKIWGYLRVTGITRYQGIKIRCIIALLINIIAIILAIALILILLLILEPYDREYLLMFASPIILLVSGLISICVSQTISYYIVNAFWKSSIIEMVR